MDELIWGLQMTALGMGLVFGLLALLWGLLTLVLRLEPAAVAAPAAAAPVRVEAGDLDAQLVAAIVAATLVHRRLRRGEAAPVMRSYLPGSQLHSSRWVGAGRTRQNQSWQRGSR